MPVRVLSWMGGCSYSISVWLRRRVRPLGRATTDGACRADSWNSSGTCFGQSNGPTLGDDAAAVA